MTQVAAELRGVSKTFGNGPAEVRALDNVSIQLRAGELTLIEGPSGSGKTTLLHILGLLQKPDVGQVIIGGKRADDLGESQLPDERRRNVAFIFQGHNLLEALTVHDNVAIARLLADDPHQMPPVSDYLQRFGLQGRADHLPPRLSGGEKQRATIARALACRGRLVLADEPTANLDWENAREVVAGLAELAHRDGRAVVMVSHDSRLQPFADRIISLLDGRISDGQPCRDTPMNEPPSTTKPTPTLGPTQSRSGVLVILLALCVLILLAALISTWVFNRGSAPTRKTGLGPPPSEEVTPYVAAAPAVVEPSTQLVALRSERQGRIKSVLKRAGDPVVRGEPLVILDDATAQAQVQQRRADLALAEADLAKLKAWDRPERRAQAKAGVDRAQARVDLAERELKRIEDLYKRTAAPSTEVDRALEEKQSAMAELEEARQIWKMSEAGPTREEVAVAEACVQQAAAALRAAETELSLLTITSPLDGHVIYRHLEPGEVVDPESPVPILSVGNLEHVRLRAEVDEADIKRVRVGQPVIATAEAFGDREFTGHVVHLEPMMGRKTIRTERTTEQQDVKVREVLIELDDATPSLPIDLQMTVRFLVAPSSPASTTSTAQ